MVSSSRYTRSLLHWKSMPRYEMSMRSAWPLSTSTAHGTSPPSDSSPSYGRSYSVVILHGSYLPVVASILVTREQSRYSRCGSRTRRLYWSTTDHGGCVPDRCLLNTGAMSPSAYVRRSSKSHSSGLPVAAYLTACERW